MTRTFNLLHWSAIWNTKRKENKWKKNINTHVASFKQAQYTRSNGGVGEQKPQRVTNTSEREREPASGMPFHIQVLCHFLHKIKRPLWDALDCIQHSGNSKQKAHASLLPAGPFISSLAWSIVYQKPERGRRQAHDCEFESACRARFLNAWQVNGKLVASLDSVHSHLKHGLRFKWLLSSPYFER